MPQTAKRIWAQLGNKVQGFPGELRWAALAEPADPAGRKIGKVKHLFKRIEDETVEAEVEALKGGASGGGKAKKKEKKKKGKGAPPGPKESLSFEEWCALDIRMARVKSAEPVEGTDKLMHLQLDVGGETRSVVSGIRQFYGAEDLVGRQVVYLANLAPRKMRGILSQGMVLAANDTGNVPVLLGGDREVPDGARVS